MIDIHKIINDSLKGVYAFAGEMHEDAALKGNDIIVAVHTVINPISNNLTRSHVVKCLDKLS